MPGAASAVGYILLGVTGSNGVGLLAALVALAVGVLWVRSPKIDAMPDPG
jgi:hypothetical protein